MVDTLALDGLVAAACGLIIGIERGWRQRTERDGSRISGVRTFTLIGGVGGLASVIATVLPAAIAAIIVAAVAAALIAAYLRDLLATPRRDATTFIVSMMTLLLGLLAGAGFPGRAIAGAALVTFVLATRRQSHRFVAALTPSEVEAFALFAVLSVAILPLLPNAAMGPFDAWNPFKLWLIVLIVISFSVAGYIANRVFGEKRGTIGTALIGGAYSSTAVTAALSARLSQDEPGPQSTGIALATAVMYCRVLILTAVLVPEGFLPLAGFLAPAALVAWLAALGTWKREGSMAHSGRRPKGQPFHLLSAIGFTAITAATMVGVRWAQVQIGEAGAAWSLFAAGSLDVDAAIITLSSLPQASLRVELGALALAGTVIVNMAVKIAVVFANAGWRRGQLAGFALLASEVTLIATVAARLLI